MTICIGGEFEESSGLWRDITLIHIITNMNDITERTIPFRIVVMPNAGHGSDNFPPFFPFLGLSYLTRPEVEPITVVSYSPDWIM